MNNKQGYIGKIIDVVVDCCSMQIDEIGTTTFTRNDVIGASRKENVVMTRCVLVMQILREGYSVSTCAELLHRTEHAIRNLRDKGHQYLYSSKAFSIAYAEATLKINNIRKQLHSE